MILLFLLALLCLNAAYAQENNTMDETSYLKEIKDSNYDFNSMKTLTDNAENSNYDLNAEQTSADNLKENSNSDFNAVQTLIDEQEDNGPIYLEDKTYTSNGNSIHIDKNIKIYGKNTILDAKGLSGIFTISEGKELSLINITLINSKETAIDNHGKLTIEDSIFNNNSGSYGGVIINRGDLIINNSKFSNNKAAQGGVVYNYKNVSIENSEFIRNSASHKCGVIYSNAGEVNITGSFFQYNDGSDEGGCIFLPGGFLNIDTSRFLSNKAQSYGGAIDNSGGTAVIKNSIFEKNRAYGAGAIDNSGDTTVINSNFTNNKATINGGAIDNNGKLNMTGCILKNNNAGEKGGAVMARKNTSISHSLIVNNSASIADAIYEDEENILLSNNWWGSDNPDFNSLLNFEIDDDFRWIISDGSDKDIIDTLTKTTSKNNEISDLEHPELLPPHESHYSSNEESENNEEIPENDNSSSKSIDNPVKNDLKDKTKNSPESLLKTSIQKSNGHNSFTKKLIDMTERTENEIEKNYFNETEDRTDNVHAWILWLVVLLIIVGIAYKKYKN